MQYSPMKVTYVKQIKIHEQHVLSYVFVHAELLWQVRIEDECFNT